MSDIRLGAFDIFEAIGQGGLGLVLRGEHRSSGLPVAVKVITAQIAREKRIRVAFQREARAMAGLEHPGIVAILEYGAIPRSAAAASDGQMVAGSPVLVMELAAGTLGDLAPHLDWTRLKQCLLDVLDGLAHAHAHGVIHRDLKPENVLIFQRPDGGWHLKLTDFGLAHATDALASTEAKGRTAGTPPYMAPEQFLGYWRDYGPWTDLYAFGCMAYELATGKLPFRAKNLPDLVGLHLNEPPPPLEARCDVPAEFEGWLLRLLHKDPAQRFQNAADAAWSLRLLAGEGEGERARGVDAFEVTADLDAQSEAESGGEDEATMLLDVAQAPNTEHATVMLSREELDEAIQSDHASSGQPKLQTLADLAGERVDRRPAHEPYRPSADETSGPAPLITAPLPSSWQANETRRPMKLVGAGLGLYGLRPVPMVDREAQREAIWSALHAVHEHESPRALVLEGPMGTGKSRLAEWMGYRAREVGGAILLKATHGEKASIHHGLAMMLARHIRCAGLRRQDIHKRLQQIFSRRPTAFDDIEAMVLSEVLMPAGHQDPEDAGGGTPFSFSGAEERYSVIERYLQRVGRERPIVLWLDDVQWGADTLAFVRHLLHAPRMLKLRLPVLAVVTVRSDLLAQRRNEARLLGQLKEHEDCSTLEVPLFEPPEQTELVERLLGLESGLTESVVDRTGGNPLFAVQLVGDWVRRGVLRVGQEGFVLRAGETAAIPDNLHALWTTRVDGFVAELEAEGLGEVRVLLELAAALGREVRFETWRQVAQQSRLQIPPELLDRLLDSGLAVDTDVGFSFVHGMLVESLARSAFDGGRWADHHRACVQFFWHLYQARLPGYSELIAYHMRQAGDESEALEPLLIAANEALSQSDFDHARDLLGQREEAMANLNLPQTDPRWAEGWMCETGIAITQGALEDAEWSLGQAEKVASHLGSPVLGAELTRMRGVIAQKRGEVAMATQCFEDAIQIYHQLGARQGIADCLNGLGTVFQMRGDLDRSAQYFEHGLELFEQEGDWEGVGMCVTGLAETCRQMGDFDRAHKLFERAISYFDRAGNRVASASSLNNLGEVERSRGTLDEAEHYYREAIEQLTQLGSKDQAEPRNNLALVLLERGSWSEARTLFETVLNTFLFAGRYGYAGVVQAELLPCCAAEEDWGRFDGYLESARQMLDDHQMVEEDVARTAELAGQLCSQKGEHQRAFKAYGLARDQWGYLDRHEDVSRVRDAQNALPA